MTDVISLTNCEAVVPLGDELLFRQIPNHLWDGRVGRPRGHAFGPADADKKMPSFSRESVVSAQESRDWHTRNVNETIGVWACSSDEVGDTNLRAVDDSDCPVPDTGRGRAPGHAYLDYRGVREKPDERDIRTTLWKRAVERGEIATERTPD